MCLGIPGKVVEMYEEHDVLMGKVDFGGVCKRVCLAHAPEVRRGQYVIVHVGNLVCPAVYDLGEDFRAVLFSVTEGEDKPLKYPTIFNTSDLAILTKMDVAVAVGFDLDAARQSVRSVRPDMKILEVSAKTGDGMSDWIELLELRRRNALEGS